MASNTQNLNGSVGVKDNPFVKKNREENKKLRNQGLEYISKTGKTVAAKKQPEQLCNCPQKCDEKVPEEVRKHLFAEFYKLGNHIQQNDFLQKYIEVRSVRKRLWDDDELRVGGRLQRRVSCKYHVPLGKRKSENDKTNNNSLNDEKSKDENNSTDVNTSKPKSLPTSDNLKTNGNQSSLKKEEDETVEICQKAFMNMYAITEKRIRLQREKLILQTRVDAGIPYSEGNDSSTPLWAQDLITELGPLLMNKQILANISTFRGKNFPPDIPTKILVDLDNDIAIVTNFFCNQLWKPEYIGCDKISPNKDIENNSKSVSSL